MRSAWTQVTVANVFEGRSMVIARNAGIDHLYAMKTIVDAHARGDKVCNLAKRKWGEIHQWH